MCINYFGVYCCITLLYGRCNQSERAAVNSWLEEKLIYVVLKLVTKCYYRMIYILNCVKLKLMVRFSLRCILIIVAVDRSSQLFHLLFNWQVQKGVCKTRNLPGTYRNLPEPTGTCRNQPEPTGTCRNHPEPTRNPPETKIIKIK